MQSITSQVAFEKIPLAALLLESDGVVIAANPAAEAAFGRAAALLQGRSLAEVITEPSELRALLDPAHGGDNVHEVNFTVAGAPRCVKCMVSRIEAEGRTILQLFAMDFSARKLAEAAARNRADEEQKSSMMQRLESLGIIAGGVAHDFNNLLVGVLAESSAAREDPALSETTRDSLRRIEAAAQRMAHLTRQMLAYAGRGRFIMQRIAPDELLAESVESLTRAIRPDVELVIRPGSGNAVVDADPSLLRQVLSNLVVNASDADSKTITVSTELTLHNIEPWWQLEIADDGVGIAAPTLARIFEPFFSTRPERHGLGLSAVHGIVRRLGGEIEVDSKPGHGTRFTVRLPAIAGGMAPRRRPHASSPPPAKLAGLRVLVADDEPSVRATVRRLLERRGAAVVLAADGVEAEERLREAKFGLVVLDVVMPGRSGYDVLAVARQLHPRCPIVLMSGYTDRVRGEGGDEEPDAFLEKPFTARVLDDAIDDVMQKRPP